LLRRRAFAALRELLVRFAVRQPLVISIDDLHWADADSATLFEDLLRPPHSPALLAIACCRSEEIASKPFLQSLVGRAGSGAAIALPLGPMTDDEANNLIGSLMPAESLVTLDERRHITREAEGNPFFLDQLARHAVLAAVTPGKGPTLGEMIEIRLRRLPDGARHFLETLAICGRPMRPSWVYETCRLAGDERPLVALLRAAHFVRSSGSAERVEMYHDRIREALIVRLDPAGVRHLHGAMAQTLVSKRVDDPDALFAHYLGAGDHDAAAAHAGRAAEKASAVFAFDRAAMFYRRALELAPLDAERAAWKKGLATALANAKRPAEAGEMFVEAAADAQPTERIELQRRGAEQFLIGGYIDRGLDVIRTVLDAAGIRLARSPRGALGSLLLRRAQLRWRGLAFVERSVDQVPRDTLFRIDTCWSVVTGLAMVDTPRALECNTRHLLLALDAGEPYRIARALAFETLFSATAGGRTRTRTAELAARARSIAERIGHPHAIGLSMLMAAGSGCLNGEWRQASELSDRAMNILREQCVGATWELNAGHYFLIGALLYLGQFEDVSRRLPALLTSSHESGNLHIETDLRLRMMTLMWLVADDPDEADRQADEIMGRWSQTGFHIQHYRHLQARAMTALYRGDGEGAWRLFAKRWASLQRTLILRVQYLRIETRYLRARCALAAAACGDRRRFLAIARREARLIEREHMAWSDPLACLVGAGLARMEGHSDIAERRLIEAADGFNRADMKLYAAIARRRLGSLLGDDRGRQMVRQSDEWMVSQTIRNPQRIARMLAPGFTDVSA
jgi:tetratricopeptide (TPR) repeat protein